MADSPNVIFIYADDLGRGMLSRFGQKEFQTPNIDRLFERGMDFRHAYGCHICAPARASLLCGIHDCHAGRWSFTRAGIWKEFAKGTMDMETISELINNTGIQARANDVYLPTLFRRAGYVTGQIGKLEWGFATTGQELDAHGWDYHYGYYDHEMCHGYYPPFVFENGKPIYIGGNTDPDCGAGPSYGNPRYWEYKKDRSDKAVFCQDLFDQKNDEFIRRHKDEKFFLYHPSMLPHGKLAIPEIHPSVAENENLNYSEKEYASMVIRLDETVGKLTALLDELELTDKTMVVFCSDNGHSFYYGTERGAYCEKSLDGQQVDDLHVKYTSARCGDVFDGNDGMAGCKASNLEGGVRVPYTVVYPPKVKAGSVTDCVMANYDFLPTMAELLGQPVPEEKDGCSFLDTLFGDEGEDGAGHDYIVYGSTYGPAIVTRDGWKLRSYLNTDSYRYTLWGALWEEIPNQVEFELFYLPEDYAEEHNVIAENPELAQKLKTALLKECDGNLGHGTTQWHFAFYDRPTLSVDASRGR